jgi:NAD(P)-dependent dehydrogenase (short-subunit alcohol dehydrogenase family)
MTQILQKPIGSGFGARSTALEVSEGIALTGRNAIVTGGASGIGLETVRALAERGATVTVAVRRPDAAAEALAGVGGRIEIAPMDLQDDASIDAFAASWTGRGQPLDILVNNAAIMACPLTRDAQGREAQFAANHLGHFRLTARLWPALAKAGGRDGARVVALSSIAHRLAEVDLDDPHFHPMTNGSPMAAPRRPTPRSRSAWTHGARGPGCGPFRCTRAAS